MTTHKGTHAPEWKVVTQRDRRGRSLYAISENQVIVATVEGSGPVAATAAEMLASAPALLAQRDELAAALKECADDLDDAYNDGLGARPTAVSATLHRARAALASIGGA